MKKVDGIVEPRRAAVDSWKWRGGRASVWGPAFKDLAHKAWAAQLLSWARFARAIAGRGFRPVLVADDGDASMLLVACL